jgi:hypothetical protein
LIAVAHPGEATVIGLAVLELDTCAILVRDADAGEDEALDPRGAAAQHQHCLAFAGQAVERRLTGHRRDTGNVARFLHWAVGEPGRGEADHRSTCASGVTASFERAKLRPFSTIIYAARPQARRQKEG